MITPELLGADDPVRAIVSGEAVACARRILNLKTDLDATERSATRLREELAAVRVQLARLRQFLGNDDIGKEEG